MNKRIALFIIMIVTITFTAGSAYAQIDGLKQKKSPEERAQKMSDKMSKKLSLTSDQYNQVYSIMLSHAQQADQIRSSNDKQSCKEQMKKLRQSTDSQLQAVFTEEQLQKYNELKMMMKEKRKNKKGKLNPNNN